MHVLARFKDFHSGYELTIEYKSYPIVRLRNFLSQFVYSEPALEDKLHERELLLIVSAENDDLERQLLAIQRWILFTDMG